MSVRQHSKFKLIIEVTQTFARGEPILKHLNFGRSGPARQSDFVFNMVMMDDDNGQCHCSGIFLSISTQTSTALCAIG
jgi:hypothetical protein